MAKVCIELSDLVVLGGIASFGLLVFDHSNNDGKVLAQIKHFYNEVKQSVLNGDEQSEGVANEATSKPESLNYDLGKTRGADERMQSDTVGRDSMKSQAIVKPEQ